MDTTEEQCSQHRAWLQVTCSELGPLYMSPVDQIPCVSCICRRSTADGGLCKLSSEVTILHDVPVPALWLIIVDVHLRQ